VKIAVALTGGVGHFLMAKVGQFLVAIDTLAPEVAAT
jgi:hypothetical protein